MYMRFVHLKLREGRLREFRRFYEERVIPALQGTEGCLFSSLLQPTGESDECLSFTLWSSAEHADEYEKSGLYDQLLDESDEYLAEASEWRARLAGDRAPAVTPLQEPEVEAYPVELAAAHGEIDPTSSPRLFLRIVAARVEAGRFEELKKRYDEEIRPVLLATPGCRSVFLVEGLRARSRALSVTVWDSEEDAIRYELSGKYDEMVAKVSEFFSGLYQWKLSLAPARDRNGVTGKDLDVSGYHVVTGRSLQG
jgi:heme-degrading monooxygenase HmoA